MAIIKKYSPKVYFLVLAILFTMRNARPAFAADDKKEVPVATLPEVVVTSQKDKKSYKPENLSSSKYTEPLLNVPQSVTVIPQAVMQEQASTTLREVLRNTPGISMQAGEGGVPAGDNLSIRGFSARTDLFIDNIRDFGGYSRDPFNYEQIEVVKGPSSSYAGRGSTGGSVNLVSKAPREDAFIAGAVGFGTDRYQRDTIDINQPLDGIGLDGAGLRLNALYHQNDVSERDAAHDERWGIAPSLQFGMNGPTKLTLNYMHLEQDNVPDYGLPWIPGTSANGALTGMGDQPAPVDRSNFYGLYGRDYERVEVNLYTIKLEHEINEQAKIQNTLRYGSTDRDSIITPPRFLAGSSTVVARSDWKTRDQVDDIWTNQTDLLLEFNTGKLEHDLVLGVELDREKEESYTRIATNNGPNTDLSNPDPYQPFTGVIDRTGARTETILDSLGVYGFDTIKLNEQWEISGGLRGDFSEVEYQSRAANGVISYLDRTDGTLSWRGGLVYKPVPIGSIYIAAGTSFNPSAEGLTLSNAINAAANVNTDPEESRSYEIGTKWNVFDEKLALNVALFRTDKTNARTEDPANPNDIIVLNGEQRVEGIELGAAGSLTEQWDVFAGYTFIASEVRSSLNPLEVGKSISNTPQNTFNLWTTYELPWNWQIGAGAQFIDDRYNSNTNARVAPDYWTFDAMVAYKVNKNVTIRFNVYNIGDEEYIDRMSGGHFIPGPGRSGTVTTEFKF